ncbi:MAG: type II CRISPR RNA-guided endonuclease Cas9 [Bacteroidetes bacterium]|nr:type II CRISPR RNA-guided endonuclease Cas9 [Bacteroidota bacterium]MBS1740675.1 type II CRISPR RNA-guided endonuclease Cas9 [Bacteroidota bacterium]
MKKILGLDLGTNSIGWALIEQDFENKQGKILGMGSRIIPMSQDILGDFDKGNSVSQTAERTRLRSMRRLLERYLLRRERLHRVLNVLGFLPEHYSSQIDFEKHLGQFIDEAEPKLAYKPVWNELKKKNEFEFIFKSAFQEMLDDFRKSQPDLLNRKNRNGEDVKIPYDWTIYYLRKKALKDKLTKEELSWVILQFNQKRGYNQLRGEEEEATDNINEFVEILKVVSIEKGEKDKKNDKKNWYKIELSNGWIYSATFTAEPQWLNTEKEWLVTEELDENGNIKIVKDKKTDKEGKEKRKITPLPSFEEIDLMSKKEQDKIYGKIKVKTQITIKNTGKTVGAYIYDTLLQKPNQKIRGKLVRTIDRSFYKEELTAILQKQIELQPELFTDDLYNACVRELYRSNEAHQLQLSKRDFIHLFVEDILFYQRPLRSQKSSIGNCNLESRPLKNNKGEPMLDKEGKPLRKIFKVIPKSNPYYQEFRIWQWLYNLKIYTKKDDKDVTAEFIKDISDWENLFEFLMTKKEVDHEDILKHLFMSKNLKPKELKAEIAKYRWNYVFNTEKDESKKYPCNGTGYEIRRRLEKVTGVPEYFLTKEIEQQLWHIIYSVTDPKEFEKALKSFAKKYQLNETSFVENFKKFPPFKSEYRSYSEKAIKKLLPLLRIGKYWSWDAIDENTKNRIDKILTGEYDEGINNRVREKTIHLTQKEHFQGLQLWLAQYIVYDRHSEAVLSGKWNTIDDLEQYLKDFKQHSLRNPIVEQVVTETLRVVKEIWKQYGKGAENYFNEIHIELGREMKNTAEDRKTITEQVSNNENTNLRIKALLAEFKNDSSIENVRPYSPSQQEILKIYEEGILSSIKNKEYGESEKQQKEEDEAMLKIGSSAQPSKSELTRYKLWLEQKYRSPYTGSIISLSKLFTEAYQIEHIIPQSRYFDDSLSNKVICESAVNQLKDNQLGFEFIKNHHGEKVETGFGGTVEILSEERYKKFVEEHYGKNRTKRNKLLLTEIPDKMIDRQSNDTRYISKFISNLLSNIVRANKEDDGVNSKNLIPCNGKITTALRQDWGLDDVWNDLILPRFERMNELTKTNTFTAWNERYQKHLPTVPLELSKSFSKKRIDHRHHALDALVIACATRDHVQYLNNENAKSQKFHLQRGLAKKLKRMEVVEISKMKKNEAGAWMKGGEKITKEVPKDFLKPWATITQETRDALERIVVSFKQNLRVINKATNTYKTSGNGKKIEKKQEGVNWAIRKPMHKDTVSGKVYLLNEAKEMTIKKALEKVNELKNVQIIVNINQRELIDKYYSSHKVDIENALKDENLKDLKKINVFEPQSATRKPLGISFTKKIIEESVTDTGIQKILLNHLSKKGNNPELAFSPEGIEDMNKNIISLNGNKFHQPIFKVRIYETIGNKFSIGQTGNKKSKFVEAAKGTNLFFAIYENDKGERSFATIPLNEVIERQKQGLSPVPETSEKGEKLLFHLSPNDLVYVPTEEEKENIHSIDFSNLRKEQLKRVYKFTDGSGSMANFIPVNIAEVLFNLNEKKQKKNGINYPIQNEIGVGSQGSKNERAITGEQIKSVCIKLNIDSLGNISKA